MNLTNGCPEIAGVQLRDPENPSFLYSNNTIHIDEQTGAVCYDSENPEGCADFEVRFCCEGCCPQLNVSGNPELTEYYENYPGIYLLQDELWDNMVTYKQLQGYDEAGNVIFGQGIIYYWEDVGWLLGANTFTYSYYSNGTTDR